jgi:hypothetical protein
MCPACIPSATMALVGLTTSGGITAVVLPHLFGKKKDEIRNTKLFEETEENDHGNEHD